MTSDPRDKALIDKLTATNDDLGWRLQLAETFVGLLHKAYDALQSYGIDYRKLRTYYLWESIMPEGETYNNSSAREKLSGWILKISNDIDAAVRRKLNIKEVNLGPREGFSEDDSHPPAHPQRPR